MWSTWHDVSDKIEEIDILIRYCDPNHVSKGLKGAIVPWIGNIGKYSKPNTDGGYLCYDTIWEHKNHVWFDKLDIQYTW